MNIFSSPPLKAVYLTKSFCLMTFIENDCAPSLCACLETWYIQKIKNFSSPPRDKDCSMYKAVRIVTFLWSCFLQDREHHGAESSNVIVQLVFMLFRRGVVLKLGRFSSCLRFHSLKYCFTTEILFVVVVVCLSSVLTSIYPQGGSKQCLSHSLESPLQDLRLGSERTSDIGI